MEDFLTQHGGILINLEFIYAKILLNNKKIILSNVSTVIPNNILEKYLTEDLKLNISSKISILCVNLSDEMFSHVISWQRQFYCRMDDENIRDIPNSFLLYLGGKTHRIFLTHDDFVCFKCNNRGHKADACPINQENLPEDNETSQSNETEITYFHLS